MKLKNPWTWTITILAVAALITPIWIYTAHFSFEISSDHKRWGEMGSAMGGIYTPIIAFATLLVLALQLMLQRNVLERERIKDLIAERSKRNSCRGDEKYWPFKLLRKSQERARVIRIQRSSKSTVH